MRASAAATLASSLRTPMKSAVAARASDPIVAKYSSLPSPTRPPEVMPGPTVEGRVKLPWRRPSQHHCATIGTRLSHFGRRSKRPSGTRCGAAASAASAIEQLVVDRLVAEVVRLPGGTGGQPDHQI